MIAMLTDYFAILQGWLFETVVQPFLFWAGLGEFAEMWIMAKSAGFNVGFV